MTKVLFLDDSPTRCDTFAACHVGYELVVCANAEAAIKTLQSFPPFDEVWLDHDLGGDPQDMTDMALGTKDKSGNTGMDVVLHLMDMPRLKRPKKVFVHSYNSVRAPVMVRLLQQAGFNVERQPFNWSIK